MKARIFSCLFSLLFFFPGAKRWVFKIWNHDFLCFFPSWDHIFSITCSFDQDWLFQPRIPAKFQFVRTTRFSFCWFVLVFFLLAQSVICCHHRIAKFSTIWHHLISQQLVGDFSVCLIVRGRTQQFVTIKIGKDRT